MQKFSNISIHVPKNVPYTFSRDMIHLTVLINLESYCLKNVHHDFVSQNFKLFGLYWTHAGIQFKWSFSSMGIYMGRQKLK